MERQDICILHCHPGAVIGGMDKGQRRQLPADQKRQMRVLPVARARASSTGSAVSRLVPICST